MERPDAGLGNLLVSPAFAQARRAASALADQPGRLRELLDGVDSKTFGVGDLSGHPQRVEVDMACAIVAARIEDLERDPEGHRLEQLPVVERGRLQVVIEALTYFELEQDVIPDSSPVGHVDDLTIVHWAVSTVQRQLPVDAPTHPPVSPEDAPRGAG